MYLKGVSPREKIFRGTLVGAVEQEAERPAAAGGVVDDLGDEVLVLPEVELVADANLPGRIDEHVPEQGLAAELAEERSSMTAPVFSLLPNIRAGKTRVLFMTITSPSSK